MKTLLNGIFVFLSAHVSPAQELLIKPAVQINFPTVVNRGYLLFESENLQSWDPIGKQIYGDGKEFSILLPGSTQKQFFRAENFEVRNLNAILESIRLNRNVPAVSCAVIISNRVVGVGFSGLRKTGIAAAPVGPSDKWHHGSLTKSMTATLAAMMVERGLIRWNSTVAEIFPYFTNRMHSGWLTANLEQLTSNRGGAPGTIASGTWNELWNFGGTPLEGRKLLLERLTTNAPASTPGTRYEYSNAGFSIAGHMLETVANKAWEDLLREELFIPLGLVSAGFGIPATPKHLDHPWGHSLPYPNLPPNVANPATPVPPGPASDNPPAIGPSATVHCSAVDLALYGAFHITAHHKDTTLLTKNSARKLHTAYPNNSGYAHGWIVVPRPWAQGDALNHTGSNTMWFSNIWIAPNREFVVVAICNLGGDTAFAATDEIAGRMVQEFLN